MSSEKNKILVVGATGTVGSELVKQLLAAGEKVKAATRNPAEYKGAAEAVHYDFDDATTFAGALEDVNRIFYLSRPADVLAAKVAGPLFAKAVELGIQHIVNMSALGVDADDNIPLRQVELMLEKSGMNYTLLRPNWFMQNFATGFLNPMIRDAKAIFVPAENAAVSFVDIRDIAAMAAKALTAEGHHGKVYALSGEKAYTHAEVAEMLSEKIGHPIAYTSISDEALKESLLGEHWPESAADFMINLFGFMRAGYSVGSAKDIEETLGRKATSFEQFLQDNSSCFS